MPVFNNFFSAQKFRYQRARFQKLAIRSQLKNLYLSSFPPSNQKFIDSKFLVVDCEMSGLDARSHALLSLGWVEIQHGMILANSAKQLFIQAKGGAGESVLIHGIHDHMLETGDSLLAALSLLAKHAQHRILVFHHAPIDIDFLQAAAWQRFHCPFLFPYLDTMEIEKIKLDRQGKHGGLRLQECRGRYGLPPCSQHSALSDAQATAELFLAQTHYLGDVATLKLGDFSLRIC